MTKAQAAKLVLVLFKSFPNARVDEGNAEAYESAILDIDAAVGSKVVERLRGTRTFLPSIAEIRAEAANLQLGPLRSGEEAYEILLQAIRLYGQYELPRFRDHLIAKSLGIWGGWEDACLSLKDDPGGRARFIELYNQSARAQRDGHVSGIPLPMANTGPEYRARRPRLPPPPEPDPKDAPLAKTRPPPPEPKPRPPEAPYRKYTAEEIEAELEKRKKGSGG